MNLQLIFVTTIDELTCTFFCIQVGYEAGSKGELLPPLYMNELDNQLIPVLHNAVSQHEGGPVIMELVFYIIE